MVPCVADQCLAWDATVVHICVASYIVHIANAAGAVVEQVAIHKSQKYSELSSSQIFLPNAFETLDPGYFVGAEITREVGQRLSKISG